MNTTFTIELPQDYCNICNEVAQTLPYKVAKPLVEEKFVEAPVEDEKVKLCLTSEEWNMIFSVLGKQPYEQVFQVMNFLTEEVKKQQPPVQGR